MGQELHDGLRGGLRAHLVCFAVTTRPLHVNTIEKYCTGVAREMTMVRV